MPIPAKNWAKLASLEQFCFLLLTECQSLIILKNAENRTPLFRPLEKLAFCRRSEERHAMSDVGKKRKPIPKRAKHRDKLAVRPGERVPCDDNDDAVEEILELENNKTKDIQGLSGAELCNAKIIENLKKELLEFKKRCNMEEKKSKEAESKVKLLQDQNVHLMEKLRKVEESEDVWKRKFLQLEKLSEEEEMVHVEEEEQDTGSQDTEVHRTWQQACPMSPIDA